MSNDLCITKIVHICQSQQH